MDMNCSEVLYFPITASVFEDLALKLKQLHLVDPDEVRVILKLSDYGRLGSYVFKIINSTRWSCILAKGKHIIAALRKERIRKG